MFSQAVSKATKPSVADAWTHVNESTQSLKAFLCTLFTALDDRNVRYCVLHSWEELPEKISTDLDIAVHPGDLSKLPLVFQSLRARGYMAVQVFNYFVNAYYFVFSWFEESVVHLVAIDIILEHRRGGLIVPSGEELVSSRRRHHMFWIPSSESEFTYLLSKKIWKGVAPARQANRLRTLVKDFGQPAAERLAARLFLGRSAKTIVDACASGHVDALFAQMKRQTWTTSLVRNPLRLVSYLFSDVVRRTRRWLQPTGLLVVVAGPDGAGKSTLINGLVKTTGPAFRRHRVFHWRPMLLWRRKSTRDTTQPHGEPPAGFLWSVARLFAYLLDYWLGYLILVRPLLARSGLVIFDRYFEDLLIDPKRYRFGGPVKLVKALRWVIPEPDLVIVLDADEKVLFSRKQELQLAEIRRQRKLYRAIKVGASNARIVDASASIVQVEAESAQAIVNYLAERMERRHARWLSVGPDSSVAGLNCPY